MATYAIGDLQGCLKPLHELLDLIGFSPARDRLWFVGDLVNRGPQSLETLRFVRALGDSAVTVLGNHDLHLLTVAAGHARAHRGDTLDEILAAPDRVELLAWLRNQKMLHVETEHVLVHAGLLPQWDVVQARELAAEAEAALRGTDHDTLFARLYGNQPDRWENQLCGFERLRVIINAMTRLRLCTEDGRMDFSHKGELKNLPAGYLPWFEVPGRRSCAATVIFGHWSALGLKVTPNLLGLDSGCLWGRQLSAMRLEDRRLFQVRCPDRAA
ncbi:MAG: symmetrical bis(5'-nucleosyl)-tetraphosphatase [Burkholderiales bacterium]